MNTLSKTITALSMIATPAFAADKITLNLSPNELLQIQNGLTALDGYHKIIKNNLGQDTDVLVPYDLVPGARLTIAHDEAVIQQAFTEFRKAAQGLSQDDAAKLANTSRPIDLVTIQVLDLKIDMNPLAPTSLAILAPLCPSCAGVIEPTPVKGK